MKWSFFILCVQLAIASPSQESLQQLRDLMPERLWVQEFSIHVDREAFKQQLGKRQERRSKLLAARSVLARSEDYLLRSTMSGENIRMLDRYQEFEQSPFWRVPSVNQQLRWLEGK